MEKSKPAHKVSTAKHKTKKHQVHRVEIERAANGGYTATHHYRPVGDGMMSSPGDYKPSETHAFQSFTDMSGHLPDAFEEKITPAANTQEGQEEVPAAKGA